MEQELRDFLLLVEYAIIGIQQAADTCMEDVDDVEGISLQAELFLKDALVEQLLQSSEGEVIVEAIVNVVRGIHELLDEYRLQHVHKFRLVRSNLWHCWSSNSPIVTLQSC